MLLDKVVAVHNQLELHKEDILDLSSNFENIENTIAKYNSAQYDLKLIKNNIKITKNNLNNIKTIVDQELKKIK